MSPSLKPYTTFRRKPPAPVRCHGSPLRPAIVFSVVACSADSRASVSASSRPSTPVLRGAVHVEIGADLAPLLGEEHGQQEARSEAVAEEGEEPRARGGAVRPSRRPCRSSRSAQTSHVPVFHLGEPLVDVALRRIRLRRGEVAVEERGVGLVLPVVRELVEIRERRKASVRVVVAMPEI